eukprot:1191359-Prymnesium_polylepis.1
MDPSHCAIHRKKQLHAPGHVHIFQRVVLPIVVWMPKFRMRKRALKMPNAFSPVARVLFWSAE